jgi:hypothetical protein
MALKYICSLSLTAFLKRKSVGHHSKKSSVFTKLEIGNFLREADDRTHLMMKVFFFYLELIQFI